MLRGERLPETMHRPLGDVADDRGDVAGAHAGLGQSMAQSMNGCVMVPQA